MCAKSPQHKRFIFWIRWVWLSFCFSLSFCMPLTDRAKRFSIIFIGFSIQHQEIMRGIVNANVIKFFTIKIKHV